MATKQKARRAPGTRWLTAASCAALLALGGCGGGGLQTVPAGTEGPAAGQATGVAETSPITASTGTTSTEAGAGVAQSPAGGAQGGIAGAEGVLVTASSLIDYTFKNLDGATVGDIDDVIIETRTGRIPYVVIAYGGVLNLGERQLPMALDAFTWRGANDLAIAFDEAALEQFPSLDDDWLASTEWDTGVRGFWQSLGFGAAQGAPGDGTIDPSLPDNTNQSPAAGDVPVTDATDTEASGNATAPEVTTTDTMTATEPVTATAGMTNTGVATGARAGAEGGAPAYIRATDLLGRQVIDNGMGEGLVEELLLDLARGRVKYVLVNYADTVADEEIFAIPYAAFDLTHTGDDLVFGSTFSPEFLTSAPRFDRSFLGAPSSVDPGMEPAIEQFWREHGYFGE